MSELVHALTLKLQASGERAVMTLIGYTIAFLLVVFAFAAFVYAAATALTAAYGPVISASIIGGASLVLALIVIAWLGVRQRKLRRRARLQRIAQPAMASIATTALPLMLRASPIGTLVAVAAAAYVLQRATQRKRD